MSHQYRTKVYHYDTDCAGVVYHGKYLDMLLRARDEWQLAEGFDICAYARQGIVTPIRKLSIEYIRPAYLDDLLLIETQATVKRASINFEQQVLNEKNGELLSQALVKVGFFNQNTSKPVCIAELRE